MVPLKYLNYLVYGWRSADFLQGVFPPNFLLDQYKYTCCSFKISMLKPRTQRKEELNLRGLTKSLRYSTFTYEGHSFGGFSNKLSSM
jgi:hypothetical protein